MICVLEFLFLDAKDASKMQIPDFFYVLVWFP